VNLEGFYEMYEINVICDVMRRDCGLEFVVNFVIELDSRLIKFVNESG
jgi:hypothetical protein